MARANSNDDKDESAKENDEKKAQYGCELAPRLPPGVSMLDVRQQKWTIGKGSYFSPVN